MSLKTLLLATTVCLGGALFSAGLSICAQAQTAPTLSGQVSSTEEGAMEGVLVSAKKEGSTIAKTVVSDDKGRFSFPAAKLEPGAYAITIRAAGYDLVGPKRIEIGAAGASADLKLAKTRNITAQLSNAEWLMSAPGDNRLKSSFLLDCQGCHTLKRVFTNPHSADEFEQVFTRMGRYAPESVPARPQLNRPGRTAQRAPARCREPDEARLRFPRQGQLEQSGPAGIRVQDAAAPDRQGHQSADHRI